MKQRFGIAQALIGDPRLIIVDEPTAGLDPTERVRFHNLLSEIGEQTIVILSTHIVDDISNLCNNMAIICLGEVVAQGNPSVLTQAVEGRIWKKTIEKADIEREKEELKRMPEAELNILAEIYEKRGLKKETAIFSLVFLYFKIIILT